MLKIKYMSALSSFFILAANSQEKSYVVCSRKNDSLIWKWATHKSGKYIEVTGYHLYGRCDDPNYSLKSMKINDQIMFFVLDPQSVSLAKNACPSGYHFQPAQSIRDGWYRFAEGYQNKVEKVYDGHMKCLTPSGEFENEVKIYCANSANRYDWHWSINKDKFGYFYVRVSGEWLNTKDEVNIFPSTANCRKENIFIIHEKDYIKIREACPDNYYPQPASYTSSSRWYRFGLKNNMGISILPGYSDSSCKAAPVPRIG